MGVAWLPLQKTLFTLFLLLKPNFSFGLENLSFHFIFHSCLYQMFSYEKYDVEQHVIFHVVFVEHNYSFQT